METTRTTSSEVQVIVPPKDGVKVLQRTNLLGKELTVYGTAESPLFLAKEVAEWINHSDVSAMIKSVDDDEKILRTIVGESAGNPNKWLLTEDGLYEVLMQSRKKIAKQFKKGVKKILHEIRTKGGYMVANETMTDEEIMARALSIANDTIRRRDERIQQLEGENREQQALIGYKDDVITKQEEVIKEQTPKVKWADKSMGGKSTFTVRQVAQNYGMTPEALNRKLRDAGIQYSQSGQWMVRMPYAKWNLTAVRTYQYDRSDGTPSTSQHTVWNERGKFFIDALFRNNFDVKAALAYIKGQGKAIADDGFVEPEDSPFYTAATSAQQPAAKA